MHRALPPLAAIVPFCLFIALWEAIATSRGDVAFLVGRPSSIILHLARDVTHGELFADLVVTLSCAIAGLLIGVVVGFLIGLAVASRPFADKSLSPFINLLTVVPLFATGPLIVLIAGQGLASKVLLSSLSVSFFAVGLTYQHVKLTPAPLLEAIKIMSQSDTSVLQLVQAPYAALRLTTNARLLFGVAVTGVLIGEFLGSRAGVGRYIIVAEGLFDVNRIWAGIVLLSVAAILFGLVFAGLERFARSHLGKET